jgi:hypothetical protein
MALETLPWRHLFPAYTRPERTTGFAGSAAHQTCRVPQALLAATGPLRDTGKPIPG